MDLRARFNLSNTKIVVLAIAAFFMLIAIVLFIQHINSFRLIEVTPKEREAVLLTNPDITFKFNKPLSEEGVDSVFFDISPEADFLFNYDQESITIKLRSIALLDNSQYQVTLKNIVSSSGETIEEVTGVLRLTVSDGLTELQNQLPISTDRYSIRLTERGAIYIEGEVEDDIEAAKEVLSSFGVTESIFEIEEFNRDSIELDSA